jgi:hypothetical protein
MEKQNMQDISNVIPNTPTLCEIGKQPTNTKHKTVIFVLKSFQMKYILILFSMVCFSQEYHIDNNNINALKAYQVNVKEQADICVFFVNIREKVTKNGCWFIGKRTLTSKPIRYVNFPQQADLRFYKVKIKEQAGYKKGS